MGPPDGNFFTVGCGQSVIIDLGTTINASHAGYDLVYYERYTPLVPGGGIFLDRVIIELCRNASCSQSYTVFNWGDGTLDTNTNIGALGYAPGEPDNHPIPQGDLYGTFPLRVGVTIDVTGIVNPGNYGYVRITAPGGAEVDGSEVDSVEVLP